MPETRRMQQAVDTLLESADRYEQEGNPARAERYRLLVALRPRLAPDLQAMLAEMETSYAR